MREKGAGGEGAGGSDPDPMVSGFPVRRSVPREGESRTDEAINGAARDLTRGEPSPRLRHAIRSRIQDGNRAKPLWIPALASAFVLAILGTIVVWQLRTPATVPPPQFTALAPPVAITPALPNVPNDPNDPNDSNDATAI